MKMLRIIFWNNSIQSENIIEKYQSNDHFIELNVSFLQSFIYGVHIVNKSWPNWSLVIDHALAS